MAWALADTQSAFLVAFSKGMQSDGFALLFFSLSNSREFISWFDPQVMGHLVTKSKRVRLE